MLGQTMSSLISDLTNARKGGLQALKRELK